MPTISDIAKASGVSIASVSYVLNNRQGQVSPRTRERVLQAMRDLNYRPSPLFMRKHATKAEVLGVAFMHPSLTMLTEHPYFTLILDGILSVTTALGWDLILFTTSAWNDFHKAMRTKCDGRCDGVIVINMAHDTELVNVFKERGLPFVCVNMGGDIEGASSVDVDNFNAAKTMTQHLLELGHKKIALLSGQAAYPDAIARYEGYVSALAAAKIPFDKEIAPVGSFTYESGVERMNLLLALPPDQRPTAVFCASDLIAFGAIDTARERGLLVPEDISIAGFDDIPRAASFNPPLTTMRQPLANVGQLAAEIVLRHINELAELGEKAVLPAELIVRKSTGHVPA